VVKYRYVRQAATPVVESDSSGQSVRYRMLVASGALIVNDVVSSWTGTPFAGSTGWISGTVTDSADGVPLTDILITAGGQQTLTDSSGSFELQGLPPGTHNLVAYSLDGSYQPFQQGALVAAGQQTPVTIALTKAVLVPVVFTVSVPANTIENAPIRMAGNLYQLGDTFGDLDGGLSTVAARMPALTQVGPGRYSLTLILPQGADIRYKYTLGDGFWNAEHASDGSFVVRQLIVPSGEKEVDVQDSVATWSSGPSASILFEVTVPASTPPGDGLSIQFNPYGWTEPIPMWPQGNDAWVYELYSPLSMLGSFQYRYCRNDQCGLADDAQTAGAAPGRFVSTSLTPQDLQDTVSSWSWMQALPATTIIGQPVNVRPSSFWAGVEFQAGDEPTWQAWIPQAVQNVQGLYANWLVLDPTWTVGRTSPLDLAPHPGADPLSADTLGIVSSARAAGLNVALFPTVRLGADAASWWQSAPRDPAWWDSWFERYQAFVVYYADLASRSGARALILGGDWLGPALPGGEVNGASSGVPADAEARWEAVLAAARAHFSGKLYWATAYPGNLTDMPTFVQDLDGVYLLWNVPLDTSGSASVDQLAAATGAVLDQDIQPFQNLLGKPVILAVAYPSAKGAAAAGQPLAVDLMSGNTTAPVDLTLQADLYQALLVAVNDRSWVSGIVSRGYYPPAVLMDASASVHGKPAATTLWYWYGRMLGIVK
jgi:hypothetical protein